MNQARVRQAASALVVLAAGFLVVGLVRTLQVHDTRSLTLPVALLAADLIIAGALLSGWYPARPVAQGLAIFGTLVHLLVLLRSGPVLLRSCSGLLTAAHVYCLVLLFQMNVYDHYEADLDEPDDEDVHPDDGQAEPPVPVPAPASVVEPEPVAEPPRAAEPVPEPEPELEPELEPEPTPVAEPGALAEPEQVDPAETHHEPDPVPEPLVPEPEPSPELDAGNKAGPLATKMTEAEVEQEPDGVAEPDDADRASVSSVVSADRSADSKEDD